MEDDFMVLYYRWEAERRYALLGDEYDGDDY